MFKALNKGSVAKGEFRLGGQTKDGDDHILCKAKTGVLYYDHDGKGGDHPVQFAALPSTSISTPERGRGGGHAGFQGYHRQ